MALIDVVVFVGHGDGAGAGCVAVHDYKKTDSKNKQMALHPAHDITIKPWYQL